MSGGGHVKVVDKDTGWAALFKRAAEIRHAAVKVGVLADGKGGEYEPGVALTVAQIAGVVHYGTADGHIPPRPFLTMAFDEQREELAAMGKAFMPEVIEGKMPLDRALNIMGAKLAAEAKKVISIGDKLEENKPSTVAAKGSDRPLVDTGRLLGAIAWAIDKGDEH